MAAGYAAMINLSTEHDIASSTLNIDDDGIDDNKLQLLKLPLRYTFDPISNGSSPFIQLTLARQTLDQTWELANEYVKPTWETFSISAGGGLEIPLGHGFTIMPGLDAGYAHMRNSAEYSGPLGKTIAKPALEGILFDWDADALLGSLQPTLRHEGSIGDKDRGQAERQLSHIESFRTTSDVQEFQKNIGTINAMLDVHIPTGIDLNANPVSLICHLGKSTFVGENSDVLGFS